MVFVITDNLRLQLSARRIERQAGRAIAIWSDDQQAAEVVRKDGKFESFGYSQQGKLYLEYYEALFLLELVCIFIPYYMKTFVKHIVYYHNRIVFN